MGRALTAAELLPLITSVNQQATEVAQRADGLRGSPDIEGDVLSWLTTAVGQLQTDADSLDQEAQKNPGYPGLATYTAYMSQQAVSIVQWLESYRDDGEFDAAQQLQRAAAQLVEYAGSAAAFAGSDS